MARVAVYLRVSTIDQNLDGQRAEVLAWLHQHGMTAESVAWFEDKETGKTLDRPAFTRLRKSIKVREYRGTSSRGPSRTDPAGSGGRGGRHGKSKSQPVRNASQRTGPRRGASNLASPAANRIRRQVVGCCVRESRPVNCARARRGVGQRATGDPRMTTPIHVAERATLEDSA